MPIIDTPTNLKFNIQNLQSGKPVTDLLARVVILTNSSGQESAIPAYRPQITRNRLRI
ncbi:MAG TPA: hypothetical protein VEP90_19745 [Methylomirabilota bacterium]|nr:hypothetical protein [Methylomirabilota bacterium]